MGDLAAGLHFYELVFEYDPGIWQNTEKLVACKVVNNELVEANEAIKLYCQYARDIKRNWSNRFMLIILL